jgi:hypothetical protein
LQRADFALGVGAIALAGAWLYVASGIQESMLSDATGAGGIPRVLGYLMAVLGVLLCLRSISFAPPARARPPAAHAQASAAPGGWKSTPHWRGLVLLGVVAGCVVVAPWRG